MAQIRVGHTLCDREKMYIADRKPSIYHCLTRKTITCTLNEVPNIAVLSSGGGERAMFGLLGSLNQMGKEDLLDSILYLCGVSGSTWCMASIYEQSNWSTKMEQVKQQVAQRVGHGTVSITERVAKLIEYYNQKDHFSLTDVWAALVVSNVVKKIDDVTLSSYQHGHDKDPFPIFTVIDQDSKYEKLTSKDAFFELTPLEAGYSLAGAFVETSSFGCEYEKGILIKTQPEMDMTYIQGLCGSALADKDAILQALKDWIENEADTKKIMENPGLQVLHNVVKLNLHVNRDEDWTPVGKDLNRLLEGKQDLQGSTKEVQINIEDWKSSGTKIRGHVQGYTLDVCQSFFHWYADLENDVWTVVVKSIDKVVEEVPNYFKQDMTALGGVASADKAETMKTLMDWMESETSKQGMSESEGNKLLLMMLKVNYYVFRSEDCISLISSLNQMLKGKRNSRGQEMEIGIDHWLKAGPKVREHLVLRRTLDICHGFFDWFEELKKEIWMAIVKTIEKIVEAILKEVWIWGTTYNFLYNNTEAVDVDQRVRKENIRHFEDAGLLLNSPYFSVLRAEREIDLIISLDFSEGNPMETVMKTWTKCKEMGIPFPAVDVSNEDSLTPKDFYVFKGYGKAPTVIHMPLFNAVNCGKDLDWWRHQYKTDQPTYSAEMIDPLIAKAGENIANNKDRLLQEIESVIRQKSNRVPDPAGAY